MPKRPFYFASLRSKLILLVLIALVPAGFLIVYTESQIQDQSARNSREEALRLARMLADRQEQLVMNARQLMSVLSGLPDVHPPVTEECKSLFQRLHKQNPGYSNIVLLSPRREVLCSAMTVSDTVRAPERDWIHATARRNMFTVGDPLIGQVSGERVVALGYPVRNPGDSVVAVLGIGLNTTWLEELIKKTGIPDKYEISVLTEAGNVVLRYPGPEPSAGRKVEYSDRMEEMFSNVQGTMFLKDEKEVEFLLGYSTLEGFQRGLMVNVQIPRSLAVIPMRRFIINRLFLLGVVAVLAIGVAVIGGRHFIIRKIEAIREATARVRQGDLAVRTGIEEGEDELSVLAQDFDHMTQILQEKQEELQVTTERYQTLVETARDIIFELSPEGTVVSVNPAFEDVTGYSREEWIGKDFEPAVHSDDLDEINRHFRTALNGNLPPMFTTRVRMKSGEYHTLEYTMAPRKVEGKVHGVTGIARDITDRQRLEASLREQEEQLRALVQNAPDIIARVDRKFRHTYINPAIEKYTDLTQEDYIGKTYEELGIPDEVVDLWNQYFREVFETGDERILEFPLPLGEKEYVFSTRLSPEFDENGEVKSVLIIARDVTDKHEAEVALRESEQLLDRTFESLHSALFIVESKKEGERTILRCNSAVREIFGYSPKELVDRTTEVIHTDEESYRRWEELSRDDLTDKGHFEREYRLKRRDGSHFPAHVSVTLIEEEVDVRHAVSLIRDMTEQKQQEEELRESRERLQHLARNLQNAQEEERLRISRDIHDELGQSMTALHLDLLWMRSRIAEDRRELHEKLDSMSGVIDEAIDSLQRISTDLRPGMLDDLDFPAVIEWEGNKVEEHTDLSCSVEIIGEERDLNDELETAFYRILQEALTNVIRHAEAEHAEVTFRFGDEDLELVVQDDGIGISREALENPQAFGLNGMRERAYAWGGEVRFHGEQGEGTTVRARVPFREEHLS